MSTSFYKESLNKPIKMISTIADFPIGTGFLAFRDLEVLIKSNIDGDNALDFGCGAGRSSRLLKRYGLQVTGVDISREMIEHARFISKDIKYFHIERNSFENIGDKFDLIFLSFVLMEIANKKEITNMIKRLSSLLSENGKMIVIAASNDFYYGNWLSVRTNKANQQLRSGDIVSVYLKDYKVRVKDYLWREDDCEQCFEESNLLTLQKLKPLGVPGEGKQWIDEYTKAPFVIYLLSPNRNGCISFENYIKK